MGWIRNLLVVALSAFAAATAAPAWALEPATTGVILLHGKWGNAGQMSRLAEELREAGFIVERPEMAWSGARLFDRDFDSALSELDAVADRLRAKGANCIVLAGHSLGGDGALAYSTRVPPAALVLFAPAHFPEGSAFQDKAADSVAKARAMVAEGRGAETAGFVSLNSGDRSRPIQARAADYLSYYAPDGSAAMSRRAPLLGATPILWIAPTQDPATGQFERLVLPRVPPTARIERVDIASNHMDAPDRGAAKAIEWLKALP